MRLSLEMRIFLWLARREENGLMTDPEDVYDYWLNQKHAGRSVRFEDVAAALESHLFQSMVLL